MPSILGLDISSTAIGWCWLQGDRAPLAKSIALGTSKNDIADYPERNPGETVILAPKTRAQINKALCMSMKKTAAEVFSDVEEGDF
jgi:hypothetical protein